MLNYLVRRVLIMIPTLLVTSALIFTVMNLSPTDYFSNLVSEMQAQGEKVDTARIEFMKKEYGFDKPVVERYFLWVEGFLHGDFGYSFEYQMPVNKVVGDRVFLTILLSFATIVFTWLVAFPIGIYSATHQYSWADYGLTTLGLLGLAIPHFLLALIFLYFANTWFGLSIGGLMDPKYFDQPFSWPKVTSILSHLWIPVIIIGTAGTGSMIRAVRANLLEELHKQYVVTARAKGLHPMKVLFKYPFRMSLNFFISDIGSVLPSVISGGELVAIVGRAMSEPRQRDQPQHDDEIDAMPLIGRSPAMQEIYRALARLMQTDLTVMISGESGTGKELVARALHDYGKRKTGPFVAINMAAIPRDLIESELFGHEKGAFTGANSRSAGRFEQAEGGTLFLDEIGDMPMEAQTRLLRVLQQAEYTTVGGRTPIKTNVRIIAATNKDLRVTIQQGLFREDLFFRLNVVPLRLPPLRERAEDVPHLARHFFAVAASQGLPLKYMDVGAVEKLKRYRWPGNVRELENLVRRLAALYPQEVITAPLVDAELGLTRTQEQAFPLETSSTGLDKSDLGSGSADDVGLTVAVERHLAELFARHGDDLPPPGLYHRILRELEAPLVTAALAATRGNQIKAAEMLGLNRNTLRKKVRELDIKLMRLPR